MKNMRIPALSVFMLLALFAGAAKAQTFSVLYNFGSVQWDPANPSWGGLVAQGRDGNLYSTTPSGGAPGGGSVFKIAPSGNVTSLFGFGGSNEDGWAPYSGVTLASDGNLYGSNLNGGISDAGVVFKISPTGTVAVIYSFEGGSYGAFPYAAPIQGTDGNFYGTTYFLPFGTVYRLTPTGNLTTLYAFDSTHGANPIGALIQGTDGNFYGTTYAGGSTNSGTVFKITPSGKLTVLFNFDGTHGAAPYAQLVQGNDSNFYGTTSAGGSGGDGVVFKITSTGKISILHNFTGAPDGGYPYGGLAQATDGNFYGTTSQGGTSGGTGFGTIFEITSTGTLSVLHDFDDTDGRTPQATLFQSTSGLLYGDTTYGGDGILCACGTFYSLDLGLSPFARLLQTTGKVGKLIEILGQGFTVTNSVSFNGSAASFKVMSDTYLTAVVPVGATTGPVIVTTSSGTLTSNQKFRVIPKLAGISSSEE